MLETDRRVVRLTRLRYYRERAALTQAELAQRTGIAQSQLSHIEQGDAQPRPSTVRRLAAALGVTPAELIGPPDQERQP